MATSVNRGNAPKAIKTPVPIESGAPSAVAKTPANAPPMRYCSGTPRGARTARGTQTRAETMMGRHQNSCGPKASMLWNQLLRPTHIVQVAQFREAAKKASPLRRSVMRVVSTNCGIA
jgi:hypothetical protein